MNCVKLKKGKIINNKLVFNLLNLNNNNYVYYVFY